MDIQKICEELSDRWPEWSDRISLLDFREADGLGPVANDGRSVIYNDRLMSYYTREHQSFYIAQQIIHLQLNHFLRGRGRDPLLWKRASDAVVNAMLKEDGFSVPEDAVFVAEAAELSAEEIYEVLLADAEENAENNPLVVREVVLPQSENKQAGKETDAQTRQIDDPGLAAVVAGLAELLEPSMQMDFDWFPGMTIRDGVLGHEFRAYPVAHAEILLDTSASVDAALLRSFVRGVKGLLRQDAVVRVGCFDTRFYGFQDIHSDEDIDKLQLSGAGGTDFHVAVNAFSGDAENRIIFTDGFAEMPEQRCDAIWVVYGNAVIHPPGGRVLYVRPTEEKEKHEIDFLIT
jgi:predicted metal-dependent peptidase